MINIWWQAQINKHTREQHEGKFVKFPERKSPITELKTNIKMSNSNRKEFNNSKKAFQNSKDWEVVFQITIADLKHILLKNDKEETSSNGNKQI